MIQNSATCPRDAAEVVEAYAMGALSDAEAVGLEQHLLTCAACREAVKQAGIFVVAMRDARSLK